MATNHTANYQLNQWEATDQVLRSDFNEDNVKVDTALTGLAATDKQHEAALSQLNHQINLRGNCQIIFMSYTGTGNATASITFPHKPLFFMIMDPSQYYSITALNGVEAALSFDYGTQRIIQFTWSGNTVSWTCSDSIIYQCNIKDRVYPVLALVDLNE